MENKVRDDFSSGKASSWKRKRRPDRRHEDFSPVSPSRPTEPGRPTVGGVGNLSGVSPSVGPPLRTRTTEQFYRQKKTFPRKFLCRSRRRRTLPRIRRQNDPPLGSIPFRFNAFLNLFTPKEVVNDPFNILRRRRRYVDSIRGVVVDSSDIVRGLKWADGRPRSIARYRRQRKRVSFLG